MISAAQFRLDFPEFVDPSKYPDTLISSWLTVAGTNFVNTDRWGTLAILGQELVAAHYIVLAKRDQAASATNGIPGALNTTVTSKSVGSVSVSYDVSASALPNGGMWNLTSYGVRYITLARAVGAGGMQII